MSEEIFSDERTLDHGDSVRITLPPSAVETCGLQDAEEAEVGLHHGKHGYFIAVRKVGDQPRRTDADN